jgi:hypothetical protein
MKHNHATEATPEKGLTRLALSYPPPDDAPSDDDVAGSKRRLRPFLVIFFVFMSLIFVPFFAVTVRALYSHGDALSCYVVGCRPRSFAALYLGVCAAISIVGLIKSLARRP